MSPAEGDPGLFEARHPSSSAKPLSPDDAEAPAAWFASPLGWKQFRLISVDAREELNRPFRFLVRVRAHDAASDASALLGSLVTAAVRTESGTVYFSGHVSEIGVGSMQTYEEGEPLQRGGPTWDLTLVPWTSLLAKRADCAVFVERDVPSVLARFLSERPFAAYRFTVAGRYPRAPFTVQYRESDLNFLQRLVEHVGIVTYFEHGPTGHELVLLDGVQRFRARGAPIVLDPSTVSQVRATDGHTIGSYAVRASAHGASFSTLEASRTPPGTHRNAALEMFDFEGTAGDPRDIAFYAQLRADAQATSASRVSATVRGRVVRPGDLLSLGPAGVAKSDPYLAVAYDAHIAVGTDGNIDVNTSFEATPAAAPYRPERRTAVPIISGSQVARVIERDAEGRSRVKVRFQWARDDVARAGLWLPLTRAALASNGDVPPPGTDVLVEFLEGDPDRPIVVGIVSR